MNEDTSIPSVQSLKSQARRLRAKLESEGHAITHSASLEVVAHQLGYKDWNVLHAAAGNGQNTAPLYIGERVSGTYLGQYFAGEVIGITRLQSAGRNRVTFHFDEPVDVVSFASFSNFRQRVSCTLDENFKTAEKTGNGVPHMRLDR
jgi:hypothetical protein